MKNMVIIGAGITAINAVKAIREVDPESAIELCGAERFYPYNRIKLTKSLLDQLEADEMLLQKKEWYDSQRVNLHLGEAVQGIDVAAQEILLPDQKRMHYDKLLLANGARNRRPGIAGANSENMKTIRVMEDAQEIHRAIAGKKVVFHIGGGIQGLETAWILRQHRQEVVIAEIQSRLLPQQLDERAAAILREIVAAAGVRVLTNAEVVKVNGTAQPENVVLRDGTQVPCDMVIYATGIEPNIAFLQGTPIQTARGVLVDARMQTSVAHIYAAGDVAEFDGKVHGLWNIAVAQGKTAGYNMADRPTDYQPVVPVTTLNAFGLSLFSMGDVGAAEAIRSVVDEDRARNTYRRIFVKDQIVNGAIIIGDTGKSPLLKSATEQKIRLDGVDWERLTVDGLLEELKLRKK